jgi:hypothetical protein
MGDFVDPIPLKSSKTFLFLIVIRLPLESIRGFYFSFDLLPSIFGSFIGKFLFELLLALSNSRAFVITGGYFNSG